VSSAYNSLGAAGSPFSRNPEAPKHHPARAHCEASCWSPRGNIDFPGRKVKGVLSKCQAPFEPGCNGPLGPVELCCLSATIDERSRPSAAVLGDPLNGRNFMNLLQLRPGVMITPEGGKWSQTTNGLRVDHNVYIVDGIDSIDRKRFLKFAPYRLRK
jgi:hypothetical protein